MGEVDLIRNKRLSSTEGTARLLTGLGEAGHATLKTIILDNCDIASENAQVLCKLFSMLPALEDVFLYHCTGSRAKGLVWEGSPQDWEMLVYPDQENVSDSDL